VNALAPIAAKLAKILPLLTSNRDGEVVSTARAIVRTLNSAGLDIYALVNCIENSDTNQSAFRAVYQAGYDAGLADAERERDSEWSDVALFLQRNKHRLDIKHHDFIDDMVERGSWFEPTEKQLKYLYGLFRKLGGKVS
jgi:hypothetical protein